MENLRPEEDAEYAAVIAPFTLRNSIKSEICPEDAFFRVLDDDSEDMSIDLARPERPPPPYMYDLGE